jgi:hypothetical protein
MVLGESVSPAPRSGTFSEFVSCGFSLGFYNGQRGKPALGIALPEFATAYRVFNGLY